MAVSRQNGYQPTEMVNHRRMSFFKASDDAEFCVYEGDVETIAFDEITFHLNSEYNAANWARANINDDKYSGLAVFEKGTEFSKYKPAEQVKDPSIPKNGLTVTPEIEKDLNEATNLKNGTIRKKLGLDEHDNLQKPKIQHLLLGKDR